MIVKIQRSLFPKDANVLIYDRARIYTAVLPFVTSYTELFGDKSKIYVRARVQTIQDETILHIDEVLNDQGW